MPVAHEVAVLPGEVSGVLDADLETGSLHAALASLGRRPARAQGQVEARLAQPCEAQVLELSSPEALLVESRTIIDADERLLEATVTAYVGSRWVMSTGSFVTPVKGPAGLENPASGE